ncbi:substrate-binding domain-containing protein [Deinococcus sp. RM]|uniref:substrate-binding domain-containing protein n=1 Tax=Deinococcus sp. RM TaxID=2316359 RepID=UPI001F176688|nr:substrate-binding domain-containing protein [Deinococcus sp. RM]
MPERRVGRIAGAAESSQAQERLRANRNTTDERGLLDPALIRPGNFTQRRGFQAARELLDMPDPPTAIFAASDATAFGAMDAVKDCGLRVPAHISVVGFDDIAAASQSHPALTTVCHPIDNMSDSALRLLAGALADEAVRGTVLDYPSEPVRPGDDRAPKDLRLHHGKSSGQVRHPTQPSHSQSGRHANEQPSRFEKVGCDHRSTRSGYGETGRAARDQP